MVRSGSEWGKGVVLLRAKGQEARARWQAEPDDREGILESHRFRPEDLRNCGSRAPDHRPQEDARLLRRESSTGKEDGLDHERIPTP